MVPDQPRGTEQSTVATARTGLGTDLTSICCKLTGQAENYKSFKQRAHGRRFRKVGCRCSYRVISLGPLLSALYVDHYLIGAIDGTSMHGGSAARGEVTRHFEWRTR